MAGKRLLCSYIGINTQNKSNEGKIFCRPAELQFYTSMASVVVQIPASVLLVDLAEVTSTTTTTQLALYVLNGIFFHFQSITAYVLMDYISPVTHR